MRWGRDARQDAHGQGGVRGVSGGGRAARGALPEGSGGREADAVRSYKGRGGPVLERGSRLHATLCGARALGATALVMVLVVGDRLDVGPRPYADGMVRLVAGRLERVYDRCRLGGEEG